MEQVIIFILKQLSKRIELIILIIILIILLVRGCDDGSQDFVTQRIIRRDTTRVTYVYSDTVYRFTEIVSITKEIPDPDTTIYVVDSGKVDSVKHYTLEHKDSTLSATHYISTSGNLESFMFDYSVKQPVITTRITDTVRINNSFMEYRYKHVPDYRAGLYGGIYASYDNKPDVGVSLGWQTRKGIIYELDKSMVEQNNFRIKVTTPIFRIKNKRYDSLFD